MGWIYLKNYITFPSIFKSWIPKDGVFLLSFRKETIFSVSTFDLNILNIVKSAFDVNIQQFNQHQFGVRIFRLHLLHVRFASSNPPRDHKLLTLVFYSLASDVGPWQLNSSLFLHFIHPVHGSTLVFGSIFFKT